MFLKNANIYSHIKCSVSVTKKVKCVLVCMAIFYFWKGICIKFCLKMEWTAALHWKCWLWLSTNLLWVKQEFTNSTDVSKITLKMSNCPGRPSTSTTDDNVEQVKEIILENRRIPVGEVADKVGILFGSWQWIFFDVFGTKYMVAKFVLKLLNFSQEQCRVDIVQESLIKVNNDSQFLKTVIGDR